MERYKISSLLNDTKECIPTASDSRKYEEYEKRKEQFILPERYLKLKYSSLFQSNIRVLERTRSIHSEEIASIVAEVLSFDATKFDFLLVAANYCL